MVKISQPQRRKEWRKGVNGVGWGRGKEIVGWVEGVWAGAEEAGGKVGARKWNLMNRGRQGASMRKWDFWDREREGVWHWKLMCLSADPLTSSSHQASLTLVTQGINSALGAEARAHAVTQNTHTYTMNVCVLHDIHCHYSRPNCHCMCSRLAVECCLLVPCASLLFAIIWTEHGPIIA